MTDQFASRTLFDLLRFRTVEHENAPLYSYSRDGQSEEETYSYADLDRRAREIGGWLRERGAFGKRILLVFPQSLDYIAAFFGCIYAGAIAVPAYPPRRNRRAVRICSMVADADVSFALSTAELLKQMRPTISDEPCLANLPWQATDEVEAGCAECWQEPDIDETSIAFLQYTSGSTGLPKGVIVSHGNILHNQRLIRSVFRQDEAMVQTGWLPLHHDMGLIGNVLYPLYSGGRFVFLSPADFLQKPVRWLRAISRFRGTIGGGPSFAYDLCAEAIPDDQREGLDLSSWNVAYNGAEPVRAKTMAAFTAAFEPYGFSPDAFSPCYGMAETTLLLAGSIKGEPTMVAALDAAALESGRVKPIVDEPSDAPDDPRRAKSVEIVGCGIPDPCMNARIVDPETRIECPPDRVGEIWTSGESVAQGYWKQPAATEETFRARLCIAPGGRAIDSDKPYLRTGDLGFLDRGQLYVTGRLKDLIIYCGANHYPHDIESTVASSHESLTTGAGAAFSLEDDGETRVVIVQEVKRVHMRTLDRDSVFAAIREAVAEEHQIPLDAIVLIRPGAIPKTTSGKIQRHEASRLFQEDGFRVVARWDRPADSAVVTRGTSADTTSTPDAAPGFREDRGASRQAFTEEQRAGIGELQEWMISRLSERLRVPRDELDIRQPFARYGMDSLKAVRLSGELSDRLGRPLAPTLAYDYPNIESLCEYLVTGRSSLHEAVADAGAADEPMAVVGIGCRFPGSTSADSFWKLLRDGRDAIGKAPVGRWADVPRRTEDPNGKPDPCFARGGFVDDVDRFDARFFGMNFREADELDPQQRLLLEVAWETFEDAGIPVDALAGSRTGVFFGLGNNDYSRLRFASGHEVNGYTATGNSLGVASNRVSYTFDLRGPSLTVDTACSSSLVAVHQACASLRLNQCDMALAGGVNLILSPDATSSLSQAGMLSPTGACQAFAAGADGFVRGEGCGIVLLKPLRRAVAQGDRIYAVLRGSAINQDGRSNGLTAPNGGSQQAVIRKALADAKRKPDEIDFVEAHGTGTELGDPIEMHSLGAVFAARDRRRAPLRVGSVKTNIGHLEAAAGIAGLIKVCLALHHEAIPASLHFDQPSPHIDWTLPVEVPTGLKEWRRSDRPRVAGVSSFGFGGTNAHLTVEEAPAPAVSEATHSGPSAHLLILSAKSATALRRGAENLATLDSRMPLADVCYSASAGRVCFDHRLAVRVESVEEAIDKLALFAKTGKAPGLIDRTADRAFAIDWLFGGQGDIRPGAGKRLYEAHPVFRSEFDRCSEALAPCWPRSLKTILWDTERWWREVDVQPAIFCLQYALASLWRAWGVEPRAVLGHSLGEYAAACTAGVFSLEDAVKLVARRAELVGQLPREGCMLAVFAGEEEVRSYLNDVDPSGREVDVAAVNGPRQVVLAGARSRMADLKEQLASAGIATRMLATTHAFHSPLVEPILDEFSRVARQVTFAKPRIPYLSSLLGDWSDEQVATPEYWRRHLREPVRFHDASTKRVVTNGRFLEVGVGSTLSSLIRAAHPEAKLSAWHGLTGKPNEWEMLLGVLAEQYVSGANLDWRAVAGEKRRIVSLPTYPFERRRHWFDREAKNARDVPVSVAGEKVHPLLGTRLDLSSREVVFETDLSRFDYLADHRVGSSIVFPAAGYLELALAAGESEGLRRHEVRCLTIERPLAWRENESCRVQVVLSPDDDGFECRIMQSDGKAWRRHATCRLAPDIEERLAAAMGGSTGEPVDVPGLYDRCRSVGLEYGPSFQGLRSLVAENSQAWGEIELPAHVCGSGYLFHPSLLDACFQVAAGVLHDQLQQAWLPTLVKRYRVFHAPNGDPLRVHLRSLPNGDESTLCVDIEVAEQSGQTVAHIEHLTLKPARATGSSNLLFREHWIPRIRPADPVPTVPCLSPLRVERGLLAQRERIDRETSIGKHVAMLDALESLSLAWVASTLRAMQAPLRVGDTFTTSTLAKHVGVARNHRRLFGRMLSMLAEGGSLRADGDAWTVLNALDAEDPDDFGDRLLKQYPAGEPEVTLLRRCGKNLPDVLRGKADPLPLLFPPEDILSAADVYRNSVGGRALNALVAESVGLAVEGLTDGRGLRILEIGAGTGATTESVLAKLPRQRSRFVFTDIAPGFLARAKAKFKSYDNIEYRLLDIERDPVAQGFEPESFDLILAANVLHATENLQTSVANVRQLLAPGGGLVVVEGTRPVRWLDLTFGLLPGWWRFQDTDLRPDYPLLPAHLWHSLLANTGYEEPRIIHPFDTGNRGHDPENSIIVSRRSRETIEAAASDATQERNWVVLADSTGVGEALLEGFSGRGEACTAAFAKAGPNAQNGSARTVLAPGELEAWIQHTNTHREPRDVVFLWPLDFANEKEAPPEQARRLNEALLEVVQAVAEVVDNHVIANATANTEPLRLWIVTRGGQAATSSVSQAGLAQSTLWGIVRTLALEHPHWQCRGIDLDPDADDQAASLALLDELTASPRDEEREIAFRAGGRLVRRLLAGDGRESTAASEPTEANVLERGTTGTIEGLRLRKHPLRAPRENELEVEVYAAGLNFRDVLNVIGLVDGSPALGAECAGVVSRVGGAGGDFHVGDRVAVIAPRSICDRITIPCHAAAKLPEKLSFDDAATMPVAFATALLALEQLGGIGPGQRVLIHSATGGVGQAAVQLATRAGAEIFATASLTKHEALRALGVDHVYDSRQIGFASKILAATDGSGVDLVLDSLADAFLAENLKALARGGQYLDIAHPQPETVRRAAELRPDVTYHDLDLVDVFQRDPRSIRTLLDEVFRRFSAGELQPLPFQGFPLSNAADAFLTMRGAKHLGKILIKPQPDRATATDTSPPGQATQPDPARPSIFRRDTTCLITGGLGGLGLLTAKRLSELGASNIGLLGRREPSRLERRAIGAIEERGCRVVCLEADVSDIRQLEQALQKLRATSGPLVGVFHMAGALDDALLVGQTPETFATVFAPKVLGAWNLHQATLRDPLEHFVLFSSAASVFGSPGQANHAAANAFLDMLARHRRSGGLAGSSINWGPWAHVGAAAARGVEKRGDIGGVGMLMPEEGLDLLRQHLQLGAARPVQVAGLRLDLKKTPTHMRNLPLFEMLLAEPSLGGREGARQSRFPEAYRAAPPSERNGLMLSHLRNLVANTLGVDDPDSIAHDEALFDMGLDSLTSLELRNALEVSLRVEVPATCVFDYPTIGGLADHFASVLDGQPSAAPEEEPTAPGKNDGNNGRSGNGKIVQAPRHEQLGELIQGIDELTADLDLWEERQA